MFTNLENTDWIGILTVHPIRTIHGVFVIAIINNECIILVIIFYWLIGYISTDNAFIQLSLNGLNHFCLFS